MTIVAADGSMKISVPVAAGFRSNPKSKLILEGFVDLDADLTEVEASWDRCIAYKRPDRWFNQADS